MNIQSFDSLEDMQAAMAAMEDSANESLTQAQIDLRDSENTVYWVRPVPEQDGLVVYGETEVPTEDDYVDLRKRGYLTGMAYSAWEPQGEYGDTHVAQVIPVSNLVFRLAELRGWPTLNSLKEDENQTLARALAQAEKMARA